MMRLNDRRTTIMWPAASRRRQRSAPQDSALRCRTRRVVVVVRNDAYDTQRGTTTQIPCQNAKLWGTRIGSVLIDDYDVGPRNSYFKRWRILKKLLNYMQDLSFGKRRGGCFRWCRGDRRIA